MVQMISEISRQLDSVLLQAKRFDHCGVGIAPVEQEVRTAVDAYQAISQSDLQSVMQIPEGLSPRFLELVALGARSYAQALAKMLPEVPDEKIDYASQRSREVLTCVRERRKPTVSPWTGVLSYSYHSLGREWYLLEEGDDYCLVSTVGETSFFAFRDTVWVFPQLGIFILLDNGYTEEWVRREISSELFTILSKGDRVLDYLRRKHDLIGVADFWCPHISHNLWNMLSGWDTILSILPKGSIDRFFTFDGQSLYGSLAELFPDKVCDKTVSLFTKDTEIFEYMLSENLFLTSVKDEYISVDLTQRIVRLARSKCHPDFIQSIIDFKAANKYVVLITIRAGNRSWVGQEEGWPPLMTELTKKYGDIGFIIDGLSSDASMGWTTGWLSLQEDRRVLQLINSSLPTTFPIFDGVGRLFSESIILADLCDFFIAPIGSGMALYKWISNKSGVAFSNSAVLDPKGMLFDFHREWDRNRPNIKQASYLSYDKVTDIISSNQAVSRMNFKMNWRDLYEAVDAAITADRISSYNV